MKILPSLLALSSGLDFGRVVPQSADCFAEHVDIDGTMFRTNVIEDIEAVYTAESCQQHCKQWESRGCQYWVWKRNESVCILYKDMEHVEWDKDDDQKVMGPVNGKDTLRHGVNGT